MENFHQALKRIRKDEGKTQKEMHEFLKVSDTTYQNYERDVLPSHETIIALSKYLKHDFSKYIYHDILGMDKEGRYDPLLKELQQLVEKYQLSSDDPQRKIQKAHKGTQGRRKRKFPEDRVRTSGDKSVVQDHPHGPDSKNAKDK